MRLGNRFLTISFKSFLTFYIYKTATARNCCMVFCLIIPVETNCRRTALTFRRTGVKDRISFQVIALSVLDEKDATSVSQLIGKMLMVA